MITKGAEPNSLTQHRAQAHSDYNNYALKDALRAALVGEQKGLCCYCTRRIRAGSTEMKIEHWQCQATYPQQQLIYGNLLGACLGGEGKSPAEQHCDTRKANHDLNWNPATSAHVIESRLRYLADGTVESADGDFNTQLNDVLGLNLNYLKSSRKAVLDFRAGLVAFDTECAPKSSPTDRSPYKECGRASAVQSGGGLVPSAKTGSRSGMNHARHSEGAFETVIESTLLANGTVPESAAGFDRERAIFPETVLDFIRATQPKEWKALEALHGEKTGAQILTDLTKWMDREGSLATLRHGFKCYGKTLRVAFFKAAHGLNPELEARYAANRVGITRQLHFSKASEKSLDVALSINGIPVASVELKNPMTGQTVEHALRQYRNDRDPREPIFEFKRRMLVHFAADTDTVFMTTRLAGSATHFLPFNKGCDGGAGNPPDPNGPQLSHRLSLGRGVAAR